MRSDSFAQDWAVFYYLRREEDTNLDPEKCDCGKNELCPLWQHGNPDPDAKVQRDRRLAVILQLEGKTRVGLAGKSG